MEHHSARDTVIIQTLDRLSPDAEDAWTDLVVELDLNPTTSPFWLRAYLKGWKLDQSEIHIFMLYRDGALISVIPYRLNTRYYFGVPVRLMRLAAFYVTYHYELICKYSIRNALESFLLHHAGAWDRFFIQNLCEGGPTISAVRDLCVAQNWRAIETSVDVAPYLPLRGSWEELLSKKSRKSRYKIRKRNEYLEIADDLHLEWFTTEDGVNRFLHAFFEVEANSWKAGCSVAVSACNGEGTYYAELLPLLARKSALRANVLWHQNRPVAYSLCCHWGGWVGHLKTGFDRSFEDISAGALVIDASIRDAYVLEAREFDFLGTSGQLQPDPHKMRWSNETRLHRNMEVFSNRPMSKLFGSAKEIKLKYS